ncbi:MAG: T9SS type A sorting domain-containing protein [Bacteroidales bacterium]|nr:T9SS type A sorting domain-containing protein [Bacteroidales bacterium]MCF8455629.1 T9SS type A sorting domain-containing protein [Bacteroidales bacterium]
MKRLFLLLLIGFLMFTISSENLNAQSLVPNGGFENWDAGTTYDNPTSWDSPNADLAGIPGNSSFVVEEENDSVYAGNSAVKLKSEDIFVITQTIDVPGFLTLGDFTFNMVTQQFNINGGEPFTGTPDKLMGYYNYDPENTDQCMFEVVLLNYNTSTNTIIDTIGAGYFVGTSATNGWQPFEAQITYFSTSMPNYMNINILSSDPNNIQVGSELYVDELSFYTATTSANDILSFELPQQTGPATIDGTNFTVDITVAAGTNIASLTPTITVSTGATISPASGVLQDFTLPVTYTVTSSTAVAQTWVVTVNVAAEPDLFISEYIEGTSNNKALEIYNPKSTPVDLDDYVVALSSGGGGWEVYHIFPAGAVLNSHDVWVIITNQVDPLLFPAANADEVLTYPGSFQSVVHFNGDDARALCHIVGPDTIIIDQFGDPDNDPGAAWPVAGVPDATHEYTLRRKLTTTSGNTNWLASFGTDATNSEWVVMPQNDFTDLGYFMAGGNVPPSISNITVSPTVVTPSDTVVISASVTDVDGTVTLVTLTWGLDGINFPNNLALTNVFSIYSCFPNSIPAQALGTEVFYKFMAIDDDNDTTILIQSYSVSNAPTNTSIYDIQGQTSVSPFDGQTVTTTGIVTAIPSAAGFFIQDGDGAWNGLYVYNTQVVSLGDEITVSGEIDEYYELTELKNVTSLIINSSGNALPNPEVLTTGAVNDEAYEGVFVRVENAECTDEDAGYGMWKLFDGSDTTLVHNNSAYTYTPVLGEHYNVQGVVNYTFEEWKIELRMADDVTIYVDIEEVGHTGFALYPNPVNSMLTVKGTQNIDRIGIYNILGEELSQVIPTGNTTQIDVQTLVPGVYFVNIKNEDGRSSTKRFIKE